MKNPDEFYMKMAKAKMVGGKLIIAEDGKKPKERMMDQTKNIALVSLKQHIETKRAERMNSQLHMIDFPKGNSHIHFVNNKAELAHVDEALIKTAEEGEQKVNVPEVEQIVELTQEKKKAYKRLHDQIGKQRNYTKIVSTLNMQKLLMVPKGKTTPSRGRERRRSSSTTRAT